MNAFKARVKSTGPTSVVTVIDGGDVHVPIATDSADEGTEITLGVRPEDLTVTEIGEPLFEGNISIVEALGETTLLHFAPQNGEDAIIAKMPGIHNLRRGETVRLSAEASKLHMFDAKGKSLLYR